MHHTILHHIKSLLGIVFLKYPKNIFNPGWEVIEHEPNRWSVVVKPDGFRMLTPDEYNRNLAHPNEVHSSEQRMSNIEKEEKEKKAKWAFELVLENRKFEIEMYWKRATYFWAFIASTFAAYVVLTKYASSDSFPIFIIICIGFVLSCAWHYTNIGSKTWQRHWEQHLDLLEDHFTGPLYKTIFETKTFSVSKINLIVSNMFRAAWIGLALHHLNKFGMLNWSRDVTLLDWPTAIALGVTVLAWSSMKFGYGRGRFGKREVKVYERIVSLKDA